MTRDGTDPVSRSPDLIADVVLYSTEDGGKRTAMLPGYRCPCLTSKALPRQGFDAQLLLDAPLLPGQRRRVGFLFLTPEGVEAVRAARHFFLWEGLFVGEATVAADLEP